LTKPVRILIVDRHPIFREGLRRLLESDSRFEIAGHTGDDPAAVIDAVRELSPDLLVMGMNAPGGNAVDTIRELNTYWSALQVVLLATSVRMPAVLQAVELGVRAVIPMNSTPDVLIRCILAVRDGSFWIGSECVAETAAGLRRLDAAQRQNHAFGLTLREMEILRAVTAGSTNREIAEQCSITENTVKIHLKNIFNKLGASNRLELALFASHHRLLDV
jgi:DNA-binding NarL/FixJ family response regulator